MRYRTHLAFGLFAGLMFLPEMEIYNRLAFLGIALLGSLLPDVDTPESKFGRKIGLLANFFRFLAGHRGFFHSIFAAAVFSGLLWLVNPTYGLALLIGYGSHLVIDGLTKSGINYLHPVSNFRISGFVVTGGMSENLLLMGIIVLDVWKLIQLF